MSINDLTTIFTRFVNPTAFVEPEPPYTIGQEVTLHTPYRNYRGWLLEVNEVTNRAEILMLDDVLDDGCYRRLWVNSEWLVA